MHHDRTVAPADFTLARVRVRPPGAGLAAALIAALVVSGCAGLPWGQTKNLRGGYAAGDKVMAILPGKGPVAEVADAVREGLRAANAVDDTTAKPTLGFIANEQPDKIGAAYAEALKGGQPR